LDVSPSSFPSPFCSCDDDENDDDDVVYKSLYELIVMFLFRNVKFWLRLILDKIRIWGDKNEEFNFAFVVDCKIGKLESCLEKSVPKHFLKWASCFVANKNKLCGLDDEDDRIE